MAHGILGSTQKAVGVFDSGVGGLTVLRALRKKMPLHSFVYLGDTARVPYGTKSADTVMRYALHNARALIDAADIQALVVACNTASAVSMPLLKSELSIPVYDVITPGARAAAAASRGGSMLVLGTAGTIRSGAYPRAIAAHAPWVSVHTRACPLFVPLAEEGWVDGDVPRLVAEQYLRDLPHDVDTVVLGCTHYPLLTQVLRQVLPAHVDIVNGATATADDVCADLGDGLTTVPPIHRFLVTDAPEQLARLSERFLGEHIETARVELIDVRATTSPSQRK